MKMLVLKVETFSLSYNRLINKNDHLTTRNFRLRSESCNNPSG